MKKSVMFAVLIVAGCAKSPDQVKALPLSDLEFQNMSCDQLKSVNDQVALDLQTLTKAQQDAATGDAVGVVLLGMPVSSTFGQDRETQLAYTKGKQEAITRVLATNGC